MKASFSSLRLLPLLLVFSASPALAAPRAAVRSAAAAAIVDLGSPERDAEAFGQVSLERGVQRQHGLDSGVLRRWWLRTPASPTSRALVPAKQAAEDFLRQHATELGLDEVTPLDGLAMQYEKASPSGTHLRWNQTVGGVPVYRAEVVVKVNLAGQVSSLQNNLVPDLKLPVTPALAADGAVQVAYDLVKPTGRELMKPRAELNVVMARTGARLAWLVQMPVEEPMGDWLVFVDAQTGEVFGAEDRMRYATGSGQVFDPDPMTKLADSTLVDNTDANTGIPFPGAYDIVTLQGLTLSGSVYSLSGPYAQLIDDESPVFAPVTAAAPDSFRFQRNAQGFEDVNCYYHLDYSQRYIQSLGFLNINNRVQPVDSHGVSGADNSHYVPSTGHLAFGEGGVDDAEDADVIWHEYGHSIQDNIVPGWGGGHEGAMGEGFGDYWAGSYSIFKKPTFQPNRVFTWDGNGETWSGRKLIDTALRYPANCCGEVHASGTLWCSALIDCMNRVGRPVMDALVLDHHFALGTTATMADAANQVIQSDIDLFGGAHVSTLVERFGFWGMVDPAAFVPTITHTPLASSENVSGPYAVLATVTSTNALAAGFPRLHWGVGAAITDSVTMTPTGTANQYSASIPGPGVTADIRYYLQARDNAGGTSRAPSTAPTTPYTFHVGPNTTPPTIVHSALSSLPVLSWPPVVSATVTDDIGVDSSSVTVIWTFNGVAQTSFALARVGTTNNWSGSFPSLAVSPGDAITYHLTARDLALVPNSGRAPATGEYAFSVIASLGTVLVLDDDELAKTASTKELPGEKDPTQVTREFQPAAVEKALSANRIATLLQSFGYTVTVEPAATSNSATWASYSFLVSASGANTAPVSSATYRAALEAHVAAGRKLIVEGGEVGYDAISTPGYPTFAANVLHAGSWSADNAGALVRVAAQATHPIATLPNVLPSPIAISYVGYGNEDSYAVVSPGLVVYGTTSQTGNAGISVYDNDAAPQAGQVVVLAFDLKAVTDTSVARKVLQNAAAYLLAPQPAANARIQGRLALGTSWAGAGVVVTLSPSGRTATTDANGAFTFANLYAGNYSLSASSTGFTGTPRSITLADGAEPFIVLQMFPVSEANACVHPSLAIPDNSATGVSSAITITPTFAVTAVEVAVDITHTWRGDLTVDLTHGATTVRLHNRTGSSADNIVGTYPTTLTPAASLTAFNSAAANGTWTLAVADRASTDTGTLNQWCLTLRGAADTTQVIPVGVDDEGAAGLSLAFSPAWPNPVRGGSVNLGFSLPHAAPLRLALYDIGGRQVQVLADRVFLAGRYTLAWDGRDAQGKRLMPGVYLARLTVGGETRTQRVFLLH